MSREFGRRVADGVGVGEVRHLMHHGHGHHSNSHEKTTQYAPTPSMRLPVANAGDKKLVKLLADNVNRLDVMPRKIAADICMLPTQVQRQIASIVFTLVTVWADMGKHSNKSHPLREVYDQAAWMTHSGE